jgi:hypothetical protein
VGIDEAGHHHTSLAVNGLERCEVGVDGTDREDLTRVDRHCARRVDREPIVHREHVGVDEQNVAACSCVHLSSHSPGTARPLSFDRRNAARTVARAAHHDVASARQQLLPPSGETLWATR